MQQGWPNMLAAHCSCQVYVGVITHNSHFLAAHVHHVEHGWYHFHVHCMKALYPAMHTSLVGYLLTRQPE